MGCVDSCTRGAAKSGAVNSETTQQRAGLDVVVGAWPSLSDDARRAILAIVLREGQPTDKRRAAVD